MANDFGLAHSNAGYKWYYDEITRTHCWGPHLKSTPLNPLFAAAYFKFGYAFPEIWGWSQFPIDLRNELNETLLATSSRRGDAKTVKLLLENGAAFGVQLQEAIRLAIRHKQVAVLITILDHNHEFLENIYDLGARMFIQATVEGDVEMARAVLDRFPGMQVKSEVLISAACALGDEMIELLLSTNPGIELTDACMIAALAVNDSQILKRLRNILPDITVPQAMFTAALQLRCDSRRYKAASLIPETTEPLLSINTDASHTEPVMVEAMRGPQQRKQKTKLLLSNSRHPPVTEAAITTAVQPPINETAPIAVLHVEQRVCSLVWFWGMDESMGQLNCLRAIRWLAGLLLPLEATLYTAVESYIRGVRLPAHTNSNDMHMVAPILHIPVAMKSYIRRVILAKLLSAHTNSNDMHMEAASAMTSMAAQSLSMNPNVPITEAVMAAAMANINAQATVDALLSINPNILVTEAIIVAAMVRSDAKSPLPASLSTNRNVPSRGVSEAAMIVAANLHEWAPEATALLLSINPNIRISEAFIAALKLDAHSPWYEDNPEIHSNSQLQVLEILASHSKIPRQISEETLLPLIVGKFKCVRSASGWVMHREAPRTDLLKLLLRHARTTLVITLPLLEELAGSDQQQVSQVCKLLASSPNVNLTVTSEAMSYAANKWNRTDIERPVTELLCATWKVHVHVPGKPPQLAYMKLWDAD